MPTREPAKGGRVIFSNWVIILSVFMVTQRFHLRARSKVSVQHKLAPRVTKVRVEQRLMLVMKRMMAYIELGVS